MLPTDRPMLDTNRRTFLKLSALAGAGVMVGGLPLRAAFAAADGEAGPLTSAALIDDALRLTRYAPSVAPAFRESFATGMNVWDGLPGDVAQFGAFMPASQADVLGVLRRLRDRWPGQGNERLDAKLALIAGWLVHRTAADVIAPAAENEEARIYQDAALLRARSADATAQASPEAVAALFREVGPRTLVRFHTLKPDDDDAMGWVLRLRDWRRAHAERMQRYADAYARPDRTAVQRYVEQPGFYDAEDPIVRLARELRRADAPSPVDVQAARAGDNDSLYGRALAHAVGDLLAASAYFVGTLDDRGLEQQLAVR